MYLKNCSREFHPIVTFGAAGDKDELIRFWGQGQGHRRSRSQRECSN